MRARPFVVAIDGPAASGKGTLADRLADRFSLAHLDTGKLYRATALLVLDGSGDPADPEVAEHAARRLDADLLSDPRLRREAVATAASVVAAIPGVRKALLAFQRNFAAAPPAPARGAVLDGRDIGSVVCPDADLKFFLCADAATRARRRVRQLQQTGVSAIYDAVLQDLQARDARDATRAAAPTVPAEDAIVIDTTTLDADRVFDAAAVLVQRALAATP